MSKWAKITAQLKEYKSEFDRLSKCLSITQYRTVSTETFDANLLNFIKIYNEIVEYICGTYEVLTQEHQTLAESFHTQLRDKVLLLFQKLQIKIVVPPGITQIDPQVESNYTSETETETDNDDDTMVLTPDAFLSLAARTINNSYSGDPLGLRAFSNAVRLLDTQAGTEHKKLLIDFILTRLEGKALEIVPEIPATTKEILDSLSNEIKPESSKIITSRMLALKFNRSNVQDFSKQADELAEAMQRALITEGIPRNKSKELTIEKTIELCRNNSKSDLVKAVLAATSYTDPKEVIAKLILESSTEKQEKQVLAYRAHFQNRRGRSSNPRNRGNFNNYDNRNNQSYQNRNTYQNNNSQYYNNSNGRGRGNRGNHFNSRGQRGGNRGGRTFYNNDRSVRAIEASENYSGPQPLMLGDVSQNQIVTFPQ